MQAAGRASRRALRLHADSFHHSHCTRLPMNTVIAWCRAWLARLKTTLSRRSHDGIEHLDERLLRDLGFEVRAPKHRH